MSLPYGRRAAKALARRTGAELLELELPFGLDASERFLRGVAEATGRAALVEPLLSAELDELAPRLEWVVPGLFANRRLGYVGDPHLLSGFAELAALLGIQVPVAVVSNRPAHARELERRHPALRPRLQPTRQELADHVSAAIRAGTVELLVGNGLALDFADVEVLSLGFPSDLDHALFDRPYLGFRGLLAFCDRLANHLQRVDRALWGGLHQAKGPILRPPG